MKKRDLYTLLLVLLAVAPVAHAYRDLETGTFLTRDPIGYADGPNVYCYVHCNPITHFDPHGLSEPQEGSPLVLAVRGLWGLIMKGENALRSGADKVDQFCVDKFNMTSDELEANNLMNGVDPTDALTIGAAGLVKLAKKAEQIEDATGAALSALRKADDIPTTGANKADDAVALANKLNDADNAAPGVSATQNPQTPQQRGRTSEARVLDEMGETKNTQKFETSEGNTIPDFVNDTQVGEIKDTKRVSNTTQIRAQKEAAKKSGKEHVTVTGNNTTVSKPAATDTTVVRRSDLGPQTTDDTTGGTN